MAIFNSYVKLPEGKYSLIVNICIGNSIQNPMLLEKPIEYHL